MNDDLKLCPACGEKPTVSNELTNGEWATCNNPECMFMGLGFPLDQWNKPRPIEDIRRADLRLRIGKGIAQTAYWKAQYEQTKQELDEARHELAMKLMENSELREVGSGTVVQLATLKEQFRKCRDFLKEALILNPTDNWQWGYRAAVLGMADSLLFGEKDGEK